MPTNFPGGIDAFLTLVDHVDNVLAKQVNDLQDAVRAIQIALGITPMAGETDVSARIGTVETKFDAAFDAATGHKHTGTAGDAPKIDSANATYVSGITGFTPATAAAALDALAGVRIVERGSNANGEYIRYEDGEQVCVGAAGISFPAGGGATVSLTVTFPAAFLTGTMPFVIATPGVTARMAGYTARNATQATFSFTNIYSTGIVAATGDFCWYARGRWK